MYSKKINFVALFVIINFAFLFQSCNSSKSEIIEPINDKVLRDTKTIADIKNFYSTNISSSNMKTAFTVPSFDFDKIYEVDTEIDVNAFAVKSDDYDNSNVKWSIGFYGENTEITDAILFKITVVSSSETIIEQYSTSLELLIKVKADSETETVTILETYSSENGKVADWGRDTASCMADLYSNHGWLSVGLIIGTGFYPGVAVSAAAACAIHTY